MALSVETSELVEIFQWLDFEQAANLSEDKKEHLNKKLQILPFIYLEYVCTII